MGFYVILLSIINMFTHCYLLLHISLNTLLHLSIVFRRLPRFLKYDSYAATIHHILRVILFSIYLNIDMVKEEGFS